MKNTGYQQAVIAKKISRPGELPLDAAGNLCVESGKKQAILLLEGEQNPFPDEYEVVGFFNYGDIIDGFDTRVYNPEACPLPVAELPPYIKLPISTKYIDVREELIKYQSGESYNIYSKDWDTGLNTDFSVGGGWNRGTYHTRVIGEYEYTLENWKMSYIPDRNYGQYRLTQEIINASNIGSPANMTLQQSEEMNGCYAFGGKATDRYMAAFGVFDPDKKYFTDTVNANLWGKAVVYEGIDLVANAAGDWATVTANPNAFTMIIPGEGVAGSGVRVTTTRTTLDTKFKIWTSKSAIDNTMPIGAAYDGGGNNKDLMTGNPETDLVIKYSMGPNTPKFWAVTFIHEGVTSFDDLPRIKVEFGSASTDWIAHREDMKEDGWILADKAAWEQLLATVGENITSDNIMKHLCVSPNDTELPWFSSWTNSDLCEDIIGSRLLPAGHKRNEDLANGGYIYQFGERMAHTSWDNIGEAAINPSFWVNNAADASNIVHVAHDLKWKMPEGASLDGWQRFIRFARPLTNAELGYRLYRQDSTDKVLVLGLNETPPADAIELERGLLRGLARRWMDADKTEVVVPLSYLLSIMNETEDNAGYLWWGWHD